MSSPHNAGRQEGQTPEGPRGIESLPAQLAALLIYGRWVVILTVVLTLTLEHRFPVDSGPVLLVGAGGLLHNLYQIWLLRTRRILHYSPILTIGADLVIITLLDWYSGGIRSPFVDLYYLVILAGAAYGELRGALLTALSTTALELATVILRPLDVFGFFGVSYFISRIPYAFLMAFASGYLVRRLRHQYEMRRQAEEQLVRITMENNAVRREMEIAREVQSTFLHATPPKVPGLAIAAHSEPLHGVGGDLQDYVPLPDGVAIAVADVSGHSLSAALLAARLSHLLEDVGLGQPLGQVMDAWHHAIYDRTPPEVFVTAVFCEMHPQTGLLRYSVAGHPPPMVWRKASATVDWFECGGPALGILPDTNYKVCQIVLEPGDVLLLYTDGAPEARTPNGEMLETEGLAELLSRHAALPTEEMVQRIASGIHEGREVRDDLTLVAIRRTEDSPTPT